MLEIKPNNLPNCSGPRPRQTGSCAKRCGIGAKEVQRHEGGSEERRSGGTEERRRRSKLT